MDRRSRACMLWHTRYTDVVEVGQIVGTRNTVQQQNMRRENAPGHSGLGVSCLRVIGKRSALSVGEENEDGTAQQYGRQHGGDVGVWGKPDLVAWARKLGIDKISTHRFVPASCHDRVLASAQ